MDLWQWHCRNRWGGRFCNWFVAMPLPKYGKKFVAIVAMPLPKMGGKKNSGCRNLERNEKKKCYDYNIFITFSQ